MRVRKIASDSARFEKASIRRRRILVAPSEYPDIRDPLKFNGNWAEEQTRAVAGYHDIAVVYPVLTANGNPRIERLDYHGVRTLIVNYRHVRKTWISPYILAAWKGLKVARAEMRPECIHAHGLYPAGFAAVLIGGALRIPVVITEHWGRLCERVAEGRLIRGVLKYTLRRATKLVAVSRFLAEEMRELEPRCSPDVVPNIVADIFQAPSAATPRRATDDIEMLFVGSLRDSRKGVDVLLHALRKYLDLPDARRCRLSVIGEGGKRADYEDLAHRLGLRNQVAFLGSRSRENVAIAMADCDLFVMPSRYETFGVVYAEAMACGKPVIACSGGPAEEIIPPWAGELAPPGDHIGLAHAIHRVTSNLDGFDRARISEYAKKKFGPEAVVSALSEVYERAISGGAKILWRLL
jgi:glycosyltransferase involved in cell wall biosynthesis